MYNILVVGAHGVSMVGQQAKCQRCGGNLQRGWNYCPYCGTTVAGNSQVTAELTLLGTVKYELPSVLGGGNKLTL